MFRMILGCAGVCLVATGLFGGGILDNAVNRFTGNGVADNSPVTAKVEVPAASETNSNTAVELLAKASEGQEVAIQPAASAENTETATAESSAVVEVAVEIETEGQSQPQAVAAVETQPAQTNNAPAAAMIAISDEVVAKAADQAPVSQIQATVAATDEQKASARNEQVALAENILTSSVQSDSVSVAVVDTTQAPDKTQDLEQALSSIVPPDTAGLMVLKSKVNLREGPSIDHPIVLQLEQGQELMEFKREGRWIHVGAYGTSGKIGWVHQRLVGPNE